MRVTKISLYQNVYEDHISVSGNYFKSIVHYLVGLAAAVCNI